MHRMMGAAVIVVAGLSAGCAAKPAAPVAPDAPSGIHTVADDRLRKVVLRRIAMAESTDGSIGNPTVVSVAPVSREGVSVLEHWVVDSNGRRVEYRVLFRPSPQGGTEVGVAKVED